MPDPFLDNRDAADVSRSRPAAARGPFGPLDRPPVEARHADGRWYPGRLHGWVGGNGRWRAVVTYGTTPGIQFYRCLLADAVRRPDDEPDDEPENDPDDAKDASTDTQPPGVSMVDRGVS